MKKWRIECSHLFGIELPDMIIESNTERKAKILARKKYLKDYNMDDDIGFNIKDIIEIKEEN